MVLIQTTYVGFGWSGWLFYQFSTNKCTDIAYKGRSVELSSCIISGIIDAFAYHILI